MLFLNTILTDACFFSYKLHHLLWYSLISNITWAIPTVHYCLPCCMTMPHMAKGVEVVCLANKSKPVRWLQVMNAMNFKVKC